jgi:hypothetical protein
MASRTVFDRVWDIIDGLDILYVGLILVSGIAWGAFTLGSWIVAAAPFALFTFDASLLNGKVGLCG